MRKPFTKEAGNVCLANGPLDASGSCRRGTVYATYEQLAEVLGPPHACDWSEEAIHGDGKVHFSWYFKTPRGVVEIGDYWWNPKNEQSIRTAHNGAYWWVKGLLKNLGIKTRQGG